MSTASAVLKPMSNIWSDNILVKSSLNTQDQDRDTKTALSLHCILLTHKTTSSCFLLHNRGNKEQGGGDTALALYYFCTSIILV